MTQTNSELEIAKKRIEELENAIKGALNCRDLWGNPSDLSHVEDCHLGEIQMLQAMEDEFKRLVGPNISHRENCKDLYTACKDCCDRFDEWRKQEKK